MVNARRKGAAAENEFKNELKARGVDCERNLSQTRDGGHDIDDLPFALEIKRQERMDFPACIRQTKEQAELSGKQGALAWRRNREKWTIAVIYTIDEFAELCKRI